MDIFVRKATVEYGERRALEVGDLHFAQGNVYSIMGLNGSGKSTLLNCIAGLQEFDGEIMYGASSQTNVLRDRLSIMLQKPYLFSGSVYDNIGSGLKFRKAGRERIEEKVKEYERYFDFCDMRKKDVSTLSGGEAAKTAILRCAVLETEVTLLDEPTASMDIESTFKAESLIRKMAENKRTVIVVTHDLYQAERISDYVLIMDKGTVIENGRKTKVFNAPKHPLAKAILNV